MQDSWIKAFENTRLVKMGGMCFECCDYEDMVDDMKAFISQVEKDAIEKTNKRWRERIVNLHKLITPAGLETPDMCFDQLADIDDMLTNLLKESE